MRCSQVEKQLAEYVDGLLDVRRGAALEAHLAECEACQAAVADVSAAKTVLRDAPPVRPPAEFAPRLRSAIRSQAPRALAPALLGGNLRTALSLAGLTMLGLLAAHAVVRPRPFPGTGAPQVAMRVSQPRAIQPRNVTAERTTERSRGETRAAGVVSSARWAEVAVRVTKGILREPPSRAPLLPKPTADPSETSRGPAVVHAALPVAVMPDLAAEARLTDEVAEISRLPELPAEDVPPGDSPAAPRSSMGSPAPVFALAGESARGDTPFGFDDLFSERSLASSPDVS